uniref:H0711G06.10 protein n=1 Tax=Oryza sativa TaxID=4530 RepID=I7HIL8_ORYSA|nr:H0711G06.10 [Oryza sativa]
MAAIHLFDLNAPPPEDGDELRGGEAIADEAGVNIAGDEGGGGAVADEEIAQNVGNIASDEGVQPQERKIRRWLSDKERYAVYIALHAKSKGGRLEKDTTKKVAEYFNVGIQVIQRIWKHAREQVALGLKVDVDNRKTRRCGPNKMEIDLSKIATIPLNRRSNLRSLANSLGVSIATVHQKFKLVVDMTKRKKTYYLLPEEEDPLRTVQNKNSIGKVMFLTAIARPRFDEEGNVTFSGKIGTWLFVKEVPAIRKSRNRTIGTLETKSIIVNRDVMRQFLIEKVIPAIQSLWPEEDIGDTIYIQQDNARTHVPPNDPHFLQAVAATGLNIQLKQPSNSPDMNVLDLGFFSSIQSLTNCSSPKTIQELIHAVQEEFDGYEASKINRVFLTLQLCMLEVMKDNGGNRYKIPHMNKQALEREGRLPSWLSCDARVYEKALDCLEQVG